MGRPHTILHVIDSLDFAGAQRLVLLLGQFWPRDSEVTLVTVLQDRLDMMPLFKQAGVPVVALGRVRPSIFNPWPFLCYGLATISDLASLCRTYDVRVCVLHLSDSEFLGTMAGLLAKVPKIYVVSHLPRLLPARPRWDVRSILRYVLLRYLYSKATGLIAVSQETAEALATFCKKMRNDIFVILNAVDTRSSRRGGDEALAREELNVPNDWHILLSVGRLTEQKGHIYAIAATARLVAQGYAIKLLIAGEGELGQQLKEEVNRRGLGDHVSFLGTRSDIPRLLAAAEVFILPSLYEGTSIALLEAMAAGKPIVTTDIPPHRNILHHGETALLVAPSDPDALAKAIAKLLKEPELASAIGAQAAHVVADRHDVRGLVTFLQNLWR